MGLGQRILRTHEDAFEAESETGHWEDRLKEKPGREGQRESSEMEEEEEPNQGVHDVRQRSRTVREIPKQNSMPPKPK